MHVSGSPDPHADFEAARTAFIEACSYTPPDGFEYSSRALSGAVDAYIDALQTYARETAGALTCTGFEAARRRHASWPNRETINRLFGSWPEALDAAGLRHRAHARSAA